MDRWETKFGDWVQRLGVAQIRKAMKERSEPVTRGAIYAWVAGRARPNPKKANLLVEISKLKDSPFAITLEEIYAQPEAPEPEQRPAAPLPVDGAQDCMRALGMAPAVRR